jgi:predicted esterase
MASFVAEPAPHAGKPSAMLVMLHGLGMCAKEFEEFTRKCLGTSMPWLQITCPEAPTKPVTYLQGKSVRAWFDIESVPVLPSGTHEGLAESVASVHEVFRNAEASGIPANRIIVAGFSQGAVLSLAAGLSYERELAGICTFSGWLPAGVLSTAHHRKTPIFMGHGDKDTLIPFSTGRESARLLRDASFDRLTFARYSKVGHEFGSIDHAEDLESFIASKVPCILAPSVKVVPPTKLHHMIPRLQPPNMSNVDILSTDAGSDRSDEDIMSSDDESHVLVQRGFHSVVVPTSRTPVAAPHVAERTRPRAVSALPPPTASAPQLPGLRMLTPRTQHMLAAPGPSRMRAVSDFTSLDVKHVRQRCPDSAALKPSARRPPLLLPPSRTPAARSPSIPRIVVSMAGGCSNTAIGLQLNGPMTAR